MKSLWDIMSPLLNEPKPTVIRQCLASLGNVIRSRRKELKYTQGYISEITGLSVSFISDLENGKLNMDDDTRADFDIRSLIGNKPEPSKQFAHFLLNEGASLNPGPWKLHSIEVAESAEKIAKAVVKNLWVKICIQYFNGKKSNKSSRTFNLTALRSGQNVS